MSSLLLRFGVIVAALGLSSPSAAQTPGQPVTGKAIDPRLIQPVRPGMVQPVYREPRRLGPTLLPAGAAPQWLHVTATTARTVSLAWSPTAGPVGYWVHRADTPGGTFYRGSALVTDTMTTITYLLPGTGYSFKVSAVYPQESQKGEGFSEAVSGTTGAAPTPTGLTAMDKGNGGGVSMTWNKVPEADWYRLYRDGSYLTDIKPFQVDRNSPATLPTSYDDPVRPGLYQYQIQSVFLAGSTQAVSAQSWPPVAVATY